VYTDAEKAAISSLRIAVEWSFGEVEMKYPLVVDHYRCKVLDTMPAAMLRVSVILQNIHRCLEGCNANSYFETDRISLKSYLVPK